MLISCQSFFFSVSSSQGQMNARGSARAPRHRLLHYVVQVKPLALCHRRRFSVSGRTQRWPSGFSSDQKLIVFSLSSPLAAAAAPDPVAQLFTAARLRRARFSILLRQPVWGESEAAAGANQYRQETERDRKSRHKSITRPVVRGVSLMVSWTDYVVRGNVSLSFASQRWALLGEASGCWHTTNSLKTASKVMHFTFVYRRNTLVSATNKTHYGEKVQSNLTQQLQKFTFMARCRFYCSYLIILHKKCN